MTNIKDEEMLNYQTLKLSNVYNKHLHDIIKKIVNSEESKFKPVGSVTSLAIKRVFRLEIGNTIKPEEVRKTPSFSLPKFFKII